MSSQLSTQFGAEYTTLYAYPPVDYVLPTPPSYITDTSNLEILLVGPQNTPYEGGLWRIALAVSKDELEVTFKNRIWHPNVAERSGKTKYVGRNLGDLLSVVRSLLIQPDPSNILNAKAGKLFNSNYASFEEQARLLTKVHAPIPLEYTATIRNMHSDDAPESEIEFYIDETATDARSDLDSVDEGVLLEIPADEIMEDIYDKENACNGNIMLKTREKSLSPLGKRPLDDVWEESETMSENMADSENITIERHDDTRKSPRLDERRVEGMNASGRIRAMEEEEERSRKRREKESQKKVLAARKMGIRKGLKRL